MVGVFILIGVCILLVPVSVYVGFACCLKAVRLAMKWDYQVKHGEKPSEDLAKVIQASPTVEQITQEWLMGAKGDGR